MGYGNDNWAPLNNTVPVIGIDDVTVEVSVKDPPEAGTFAFEVVIETVVGTGPPLPPPPAPTPPPPPHPSASVKTHTVPAKKAARYLRCLPGIPRKYNANRAAVRLRAHHPLGFTSGLALRS